MKKESLIMVRCVPMAVISAMALVACATAAHAQTATQEQSGSVAGTEPATGGLSDLDAMTFGCVKAGLNAAAREAAKAPAQGTYQFAYFRIINDAHHSSYEVHFKSNYHGEPDLKYCVALYCQQGWDPKTTRTSVSLIGNEPRRRGVGAHAAGCDGKPAPAKR